MSLRELSELARELQAENDPEQIMQRVLDAAVNEIPGGTVAAITLLQRGQFRSPVHTDDLAVRIARLRSAMVRARVWAPPARS